MGNDLRYAFRTLWKSPGFTLVCVLVLGLGIGANTAIFTLVNAVLLQTPAYPEPGRLYLAWEHYAHSEGARFSTTWPDYNDWRRQSASFEDAAAFSYSEANLTIDASPEHVRGERVTASLFPLTGARPLFGRVFTESEEQPGWNRVVVLSESFWRRLGADPNLKTLRLDGEPYGVIGVLPAGYAFPPVGPAPADYWVPLAPDLNRNHGFVSVIGRLKPGVQPREAQAEMDTLTARLAREYPRSNEGKGVRLESLRDYMAGEVRPVLLILAGAVAFVLLIACANVASLLLGRSAARSKEMAIRAALGAGRWRVVRLWLTESLLMALLGSAMGLLFAGWGAGALAELVPEGTLSFFGRQHIAIEWNVLAFAVLSALGTGLLFGLAPVWQQRRNDVNAGLKQGARHSGGPESARLRQSLVVGELAFSLVLLTGAGLLIHSFANLMHVPAGFAPDRLLTVSMPLAKSRYPDGHLAGAFYQQVLARLDGIAGVQATAVVNTLPMGGGSFTESFDAEGNQAKLRSAGLLSVSPLYPAAMGIPVVAGRAFSARDTATATPVALVNQDFARRVWGGENPIGRRVKFTFESTPDHPMWREVVGVLGDVRHRGLEGDLRPEIAIPYLQSTAGFRNMTLVARGPADPLRLLPAIRDSVRAVNPEQPIIEVRTMEQVLARSVAPRRAYTFLLALFAGLALVLAVVGLFGVIAFVVGRRTREIGIRMALGAQPEKIRAMVLNETGKLVGAGLLTGLILSALLSRILVNQLFGVKPDDPVTYLSVAIVLGAASLSAAWAPVRRATRIDPMTALRHE